MISSGFCTGAAQSRLCEFFGLPAAESLSGVEIEFKEIPYFVVSRSRTTWNQDQGDINAINVLNIDNRGLMVDPLSLPGNPAGREVSRRLAFIPWSNILSLTITRANDGAEGTAKA